MIESRGGRRGLPGTLESTKTKPAVCKDGGLLCAETRADPVGYRSSVTDLPLSIRNRLGVSLQDDVLDLARSQRSVRRSVQCQAQH